jgi:hypothetical protein
MWFEEIFNFFKVANPDEIRSFEALLKRGDEAGALSLVKRVLRIQG